MFGMNGGKTDCAHPYHNDQYVLHGLRTPKRTDHVQLGALFMASQYVVHDNPAL